MRPFGCALSHKAAGQCAVHGYDAALHIADAVIRVRGDEVTIEDLGSKNGTYVKEERLDGPARLQDADIFALGELVLLLRTSPLVGSTATAGTARG